MRPQTIVERLDFVAKRVPGLKFTPPTQLKPGDDQGYGCFMSCDMYYIEIKVDQSHQTVRDVVISHGNNSEGISCPVLRKVLADQDFETFAKHLTGLHSIYQINTSDKKVKQRAYPALTALETDLSILYEFQRRRTNNCFDLVNKSPIGIMESRKGGLPVRLTYFITPYDQVDIASRGLINLTVNNIIEKNLGLSATVEIEGSSSHKIQVKSLITNQQNSSLPAYTPFNSQNSEKLPAQFVLKLNQPLPMLNTSINQIINEINEPTTIKEYLSSIMTSSKESLINLIARQELDLNKGPFGRTLDSLKGTDIDSCDLKKQVYSIRLLNQYHTYHILDNYLERQDGVYVKKIPFTHPTSIPNILRVLRQQALFNFVIGSCIRRNRPTNATGPDENLSSVLNEANIFDVIPVNLTTTCISFEHPSKESLATLEIDFRELTCRLHALDKESVCSDEYATKILQKCWSIPITLRSVLKKCNERRLALLEDANKRRERDLQELLTNKSTQQETTQPKSQLQYKESTTLQSKFSGQHDKPNSRDLNSIVEFLTSSVSDQFAIKQASSGGLKLTVTKTKPTTAAVSPSTSQPASTSSNVAPPATSSNKPETSRIPGVSTFTPSIKYKIPKISKTQQASQSSATQASSTDNPAPINIESHADDSSNPSSSANTSSSATSSTTNKRVNATPFSRNNKTSKSFVSSSTHPPGRITSNPFAGAVKRSSVVSSSDIHMTNRISSSSQSHPGVRNPIMTNRTINLQPHPQHMPQQQPLQAQIIPQLQLRPQVQPQQLAQVQAASAQRIMGSSIISSNPIISSQQASKIPMFALALSQQQQQPQLQQLPNQTQQLQNQTQQQHNQPQQLQQPSPFYGRQPIFEDASNNAVSSTGPTISTPSSPTECNVVETVAPPPLIPIDPLIPLEDPKTASPEADHPDDESDRLSIVDTNENLADSNSIVGTPGPSSLNSPLGVQENSNSATPSSSSI